MAIDKAVDSSQLNADLKTIADAIRSKGGTSDALMFPAGFADAIAAIQSGSGGSGLACDMGEFTLDADVYRTKFSVPHNLGEAPAMCVVWTDFMAGTSPENTSPYDTNTMIGFIKIDSSMTGITIQQLSSSNVSDQALYAELTVKGGATWGKGIMVVQPSSTAYIFVRLTETEIKDMYSRDNYWRSGATYKYFVSKKWW